MNTFSYIFIAALAAGFLLQWFLIYRHIKHVAAHRQAVPEAFEGKIPLEAHQKAADYAQDKSKLGLQELLISTFILLIWTLGGGLEWLDQIWRNLGFSELWTGTGFILSVLLIGSIIEIPMSLYRAFGLEQKYGFNKMTQKTFV